jgi:DNA modification methylase
MSDGGAPRILLGDCREVLRTLPAESVHCVVTSPPYWGLRDYGTATWDGGDPECDHRSPTMREGRNEDRAMLAGSAATNSAQLLLAARSNCGKCGARRIDNQIGLEPTPEAHTESLLAVFRDVWRVLRKDGTLWLNYGDCYACAPNGRKAADIEGDDRAFRDKPFSTVSGRRNVQGGAQITGEERFAAANLKPKDLVGMPWRLALALQADGWWLRSDIIWAKRNPMPESVTDRPTRAHEYLFLLAKAERYFYDADAIREQHSALGRVPGNKSRLYVDRDPQHAASHKMRPSDEQSFHPAGRNRRTVWEINTQPTPEAHFATFPEALVEPCIMAGTSEWGCCPECGAPWERVRQPAAEYAKNLGSNKGADADRYGKGYKKHSPAVTAAYETTGWRPTCSHPYTDIELVPAVVLDPFGGSGTVGRVATRLGRRSILIELNPAYITIAEKRTAQRGLML